MKLFASIFGRLWNLKSNNNIISLQNIFTAQPRSVFVYNSFFWGPKCHDFWVLKEKYSHIQLWIHTSILPSTRFPSLSPCIHICITMPQISPKVYLGCSISVPYSWKIVLFSSLSAWINLNSLFSKPVVQLFLVTDHLLTT